MWLDVCPNHCLTHTATKHNTMTTAPTLVRCQLAALFDAFSFSDKIDRTFVLDNAESYVANYVPLCRAIHDIDLSLESIRPYTSRDLKACRKVLVAYEQQLMLQVGAL